MNPENPARTLKTPLILYFAFVEVTLNGFQGNLNRLRRSNDFEMAADVLVQGIEAGTGIAMIVVRQRTGMTSKPKVHKAPASRDISRKSFFGCRAWKGADGEAE